MRTPTLQINIHYTIVEVPIVFLVYVSRHKPTLRRPSKPVDRIFDSELVKITESAVGSLSWNVFLCGSFPFQFIPFHSLLNGKLPDSTQKKNSYLKRKHQKKKERKKKTKTKRGILLLTDHF